MPKNLTATSVQVESLNIRTAAAGAVAGLIATVNVAYGKTQIREEFDLWAQLTANQRTAFQNLYERLATRLTAIYLA